MSDDQPQTTPRVALPEGDAVLRLAINAARLGVWQWDIVANKFEYNHHGRELLGFDLVETITFDKLRTRTHPHDLQAAATALQRAINPATRSKESYEYRIVRPDGDVRWIVAHGDVTFARVDGVERAVRYIGTIQDITARKNAEEAQRASEAAVVASDSRLRLALRSARLAVWEYNAAAGKLKQSVELNRLFGFADDANPTLADFRGRYAEGELARMQAIGHAAISSGESFFEVEFRINLPNGMIRWLALANETVFGAGGKPTGAFGIVADVTRRKADEEQRALLVAELTHRVKNVLSTVQAIAQQTFKAGVDPVQARDRFRSRLVALGTAHTILGTDQWTSAKLTDAVTSALAAFRKDDNIRLQFDHVDDVTLSAHGSVSLAMILHELATNAVKYGALSVEVGFVELHWRKAGDVIHMSWRERNGPIVRAATRVGFGTRLIQNGLSGALTGKVELDLNPTGVVCTMEIKM